MALVLHLIALTVTVLAKDRGSVPQNHINEYSKHSDLEEIMYWTYPCNNGKPGTKMAFCNESLSYDERVQDLLNQLTMNETLSETSNWAGPVPRLNITWFNWWIDGAHGLCQGINWGKFPTHSATVFPQTIGSASSFNRSLWYKIGDAISTEARAFWNYNSTGLTFWDPNINIYRDPRWYFLYVSICSYVSFL